MKSKFNFVFALIVLLLVFVFGAGDGLAQATIPLNEYGLPVVSDFALYKKLTEADANKEMVDLQKIVPNLKMDIRYATKNNVTKEVLYNTPRAFLRLPAALALQKVAKELELNGLGIVVYDGYRPYAITKKIWEFVLDDNYAASPKTGSRHNRGCAIDLGLYDLKTGEYLEMPTEFDSFNEEAWHKFSDLSLIVRVNRALLRSLMTKYGFDVLESEWWHYDFSTWKNFELMDIPFEEL